MQNSKNRRQLQRRLSASQAIPSEEKRAFNSVPTCSECGPLGKGSHLAWETFKPLHGTPWRLSPEVHGVEKERGRKGWLDISRERPPSEDASSQPPHFAFVDLAGDGWGQSGGGVRTPKLDSHWSLVSLKGSCSLTLVSWAFQGFYHIPTLAPRGIRFTVLLLLASLGGPWSAPGSMALPLCPTRALTAQGGLGSSLHSSLPGLPSVSAGDSCPSSPTCPHGLFAPLLGKPGPPGPACSPSSSPHTSSFTYCAPATLAFS